MTNIKQENGVTLIELAIVLVVLSVIIGGVMAGRTMIKNAELQEVSANFSKFRNAANLYKQKYKYLPGDDPNAQRTWGTGVCNTEVSEDRSEPTCSGNGDGYVGDPENDILFLAAGNRMELLYFWQHLGNSGFIEGAYTGKIGDITNWWKPGLNIPEGINGAGYAFSYMKPIQYGQTSSFELPIGTINIVVYGANYRHIITYGNVTTDATEHPPIAPALSGMDARTIDAKIDDGQPAMGNVLAIYHDVLNTDRSCTSMPTNAAAYSNTANHIYCQLIFITGL